MGFNGGGGGQLLNHEHDGTLVADGGPLDFKNITQSSMSAGSMTFSDSTHLQELGIGTPAQILQVSAGNIPEWAAAAAGGASCSDSLTISGQTNTLCKWLELSA